ncbi:MAG: tripartite tricarboxylate transporter TctB family protein [Epulopiscium sp.]|nr:tripartite tricarboxylate transporter TctB family protein [Candidatus Epulonipiscium sp.]
MGVPGPGYFPRILSLIVILLAAIELISSYRDKEEEEEIKLFAKENARVWVSLGFIILYFIGLSYLGFIISTIIFMLVMLMYFRIRNIIVLVAVPIGLTTFLYFIFTILLKVQLPIGKLL